MKTIECAAHSDHPTELPAAANLADELCHWKTQRPAFHPDLPDRRSAEGQIDSTSWERDHYLEAAVKSRR